MPVKVDQRKSTALESTESISIEIGGLQLSRHPPARYYGTAVPHKLRAGAGICGCRQRLLRGAEQDAPALP